MKNKNRRFVHSSRRFLSFLITLLVIMLCSHILFSQNAVYEIEKYLSDMNRIGRFNGSVLVAEKDNVLFKKGFGYANIELKVLNQPHTKFNIGSISKQFTTVLVFQLVEEGRISLEGKISDYFPDYRKDTGSKITIDHLLQHTSGLPCYLRDYKRQEGDDFRLPFPERTHFQRERFIKDFLSGDLQFEPGSRYRYSNTNFFLLYVIIEKVTEKSLEQNLKERIFSPLGMKNSGLIDDYKIIENRASGYSKTPLGYLNAKYIYAPNTYGAGSVFSSVEDLFIWNQALINDKILPKKWREKMFSPYSNEGSFVKHAYSIDYYTMRLSTSSKPVEYTSFNGALSGYISDAFMFPETNHTIIILDNTEQFDHNRMASDIFKILQGESYEMPKPLIADIIGEVAVKEGISRANKTYKNMKKNHRDEYDFDSVENILVDQGYLLADALMMDEAIIVFNLVIELNPNSPEAYNNLGNIYKKMALSNLADDAYKKAVGLTKREQELYALLKNGKFDRAQEIVERIQNETPSEALFAPSKIGPLYAEAFGRGKFMEAIHICRLWALGNPGAVGPYFSLARIYQKMGNKKEAIRCYEKILEISPTGRHVSTAKMRLEELRKK